MKTVLCGRACVINNAELTHSVLTGLGKAKIKVI